MGLRARAAAVRESKFVPATLAGPLRPCSADGVLLGRRNVAALEESSPENSGQYWSQHLPHSIS